MKNRQRRPGAAAIEFAMTVPIFIAIGFGVIDISMYMYQSMGVQSATREAARLGAMELPDSEGVCADCETTAQTRAVESLNQQGLDGSAATVTTAIVNLANGSSGLSVNVSVPYHSPTNAIMTSSTDVTATLVTALEN